MSSDVNVGKSLFVTFFWLFFVAVILAIGGVYALYLSWAITILWEWFFVIPFKLPLISTWHMFGITLVVGSLTNGKYLIKQKKKDDQNFNVDWAHFVGVLIAPLFMLLLGHIARSMM